MVLDRVIRVIKVNKSMDERYIIVLLNGVGKEVWLSTELDNQSVIAQLAEIGLPARIIARKFEEAEVRAEGEFAA